MKMFRKLVSVVAAATLLTSSMAFSLSANAAQVDETAAVSSAPNTQDNINNGVVLHAFNWSYNSIKSNLPQIKAAGYSAVQTSPVTQPKDYGPWSDVAGQWPKLYQPVSMSIAQKSWLGTKTELTALCQEADNYGIKIIVDIVANHMANYKDQTSGTINKNRLSDEVKTYEPTMYNNYSTYFHSETYDASDSDAYTMTRGHVSDCPDLNSGNSAVQGKVLSLLKECIDCGVDGFRFDAAKHIETESDGSAYSNFWAQTLDQAKTYYKGKTGKELFAYGEILNTLSGRNVGAYTKRMRVTENKYSDNILAGVNNGSTNQASATNYQLAGSANTAVVWAESHDTNMGSSGSAGLTTTSGVSDEKIVKAWAIVAARQGSVPLFFARPGTASMGEAAGDITYKSSAVSEVNKFHNAFANVSSEKVGVSGSFVYVARGNSGVVLSNINGTTASASVTGTGLADGTYTDTVTGNEFKVSGGTLTGKVGSTGVAVIYNATSTPKATASVESGDFTTDTLTVQLGLENAVKGSYALENYAATEFTGSPYIRIGSDYKVGETITLNLTATDAAGQTTKSTYVYNKKAPTSSGIYVYLNPNVARGWSNVKCYIYDEDTKSKTITYDNGGWSGTLMKFDSKLNYYYVDVPIRCTQHVASTGVASESDFDLAHSKNTYVIFNGVKNNLITQYPGDGATQSMKLKLNGQSHVLDAAKTSEWKVTTMTPNQEQVQAVDVKKGGQVIDDTSEGTTETTTPPEPVTKFVKLGVFGDVDGNGKVDVNDITAIQRHVAEFTPALEGDAKILADVDKDGAITIKDVTYIQMYLAEYPKAKTAEVGEDYGEYREIDPDGEKFSVTATSNFFAKNTQKLDADTAVFTVTYSLNCNKDLLGTDWLLTYDSTAVQPQGTSFMPEADGAVYNTKPASANTGAGITGNYSSIRLAPLSDNGNPVAFVTVTFKVLKAKDTTIDLSVRDLNASSLNTGETTSKAENEVDIVENSQVMKPANTKYQGYTSVYAGAFDASRNVTNDPKVQYNTVDPDPTTEPEPFSDEPPTGTRKILFTDNKGWGSVNIHFWGSSQQADTEWPGVPMTAAGTNGFGEPQYSYEVPVDITGMVFNGPGGQTVDVDYNNDVTGWYPIDEQDAEGHYLVDSWIDDDPIPSDPDESRPDDGTRRIEFTDNKGWGTAYIYVYGPDGAENAAWPGVLMNTKGSNGYGGTNYWYDLPTNCDLFIFNGGEGKDQTVDVTDDGVSTGWYPLDERDDNGHLLVGTWVEDNPGPGPDNPGGDLTITFSNNKGWGTPKLHYWGGSSESTWPGVEMVSIGYNDYGEEQFRATIPSDSTGIVISDNGGVQTVDITLDGAVNFYLTDQNGEGKWNVGTWGGGGDDPTPSGGDYYLVGYINGEDVNGTDYAFNNGSITMNFTEESYVCIRDAAGNWYMANGFPGMGVTSTTLYSTSITGEKSDKLWAPAGSVTFNLTAGGDGTFQLSEDGTGDNPYDPGDDPIDPVGDTRTIKFTNNKGWGSVYCYWWNDNGDNAWPGTQMTPAGNNELGEPQFSVSIPTNVTNLIFSDGNGTQTVDLTYDSTCTGWYPTTQTDGKWNCETWTDGGDDPITGDTKVIEFTNPGWTNVYCYAFDSNETPLMGQWPGTESTDYYNNGVGGNNYKFNVPTNAAYIVFSCGNSYDQTVDIPFDSTVDGYYCTGWENGMRTVTSFVIESGGGDDPNPPTPSQTITITFSNNKGWGTPKIHYFGGSSESEWPGVAMQSIGFNDYGEEQFQATIPGDTTGIVFNDNGGTQTVDITLSGAVNFYLTTQGGDGKWSVGTW